MFFLQTFCVLESQHHAFCGLREVFAPSVLAGRALRAAYCRFLLASLQLAHIFPEVQLPKADAVLQLRSYQFPGERKDFLLCLGSVYDPARCVFSFSPAEQRRAACSALRKSFGARPCLLGSPFLRISSGCSGAPAPRRGREPCWMRAPRVAGLQAHPWARSSGLRLLRGIFL